MNCTQCLKKDGCWIKKHFAFIKECPKFKDYEELM